MKFRRVAAFVGAMWFGLMLMLTVDARAQGVMCIYYGDFPVVQKMIADQIAELRAEKLTIGPKYLQGIENTISKISQKLVDPVLKASAYGEAGISTIGGYDARVHIRSNAEKPEWHTLLIFNQYCRTYPANTSVQYWTQYWMFEWKSVCHDWVTLKDGDWVTIYMGGTSVQGATCSPPMLK